MNQNEGMNYLDKFTKCSTDNCDPNKSLETLKLNIIQDKRDKLEKAYELSDPKQKFKEIKKIQKEFLKNIRKMENIDIYNSCVKANCKAYLIEFLRSFIPYFKRQIASYNTHIKDESLSESDKKKLKKIFKKDTYNLKKVQDIDNWTDKDFNVILNKLATIKNPNFIFF
jgi:predicted transglutaminase-like cysteine proteinase